MAPSVNPVYIWYVGNRNERDIWNTLTKTEIRWTNRVLTRHPTCISLIGRRYSLTNKSTCVAFKVDRTLHFLKGTKDALFDYHMEHSSGISVQGAQKRHLEYVRKNCSFITDLQYGYNINGTVSSPCSAWKSWVGQTSYLAWRVQQDFPTTADVPCHIFRPCLIRRTPMFLMDFILRLSGHHPISNFIHPTYPSNNSTSKTITHNASITLHTHTLTSTN